MPKTVETRRHCEEDLEYATIFRNPQKQRCREWVAEDCCMLSSCDSLSTVNFPFSSALTGSSYSTWHVLVSGFPISIDWVHVGEIRFLGADVTPMTCAVSVESFSVMEPTHSELEQFFVHACSHGGGGGGGGGGTALDEYKSHVHASVATCLDISRTLILCSFYCHFHQITELSQH